MQQADPLVGRKLAARQTVSQRTMDLPLSEGEETQEDLAAGFRSRPSMACDMCRRRKIKCQPELSGKGCVQCMRRKIKCNYGSKKLRRESLKREQHIRWLENRLKRVQEILKSAGVLDENYVDEDITVAEDEQLAGYEHDLGDEQRDDDEDHWEVEDAIGTEPSWQDGLFPSAYGSMDVVSCPIPQTTQSAATGRIQSVSSTPSSSSSEDQSMAELDSLTSYIITTNEKDEPRYFGRASTLSIFSADGLQWIRHKTGDDSIPDTIFARPPDENTSKYYPPDVYHDIFESHVYKPLPPRTEVFTLLKHYFRDANRLFPIYHEASFMRLVEWQYRQQTCKDAALWASINVMIAVAYRYRLANSIRPERDNEKAWLYFKNALSVLADLTLRRTDLLSAQALLTMAMFLRGNSTLQTALPLVTAAMRICHQLGLHRRSTGNGLPLVEQEQRRRVFWVGYVLDQSVSIRAGNAPSQADDFDVDFPTDNIDDQEDGPDVQWFSLLARLSVIKGRIYKRLYSAKSLRRSPREIIATIKELNAELDEWKSNSQEIVHREQGNDERDFMFNLSRMALELAYYNAVIMVNRMPVLHDSFLVVHFPAAVTRPYFAQALESNAICVQAARDSLRLMNTMPWGDVAWMWALLYYLFLSTIIVFVNILRNATHPKAREDLRSLSMAVTFFNTLAPGDGIRSSAKFMTNTCSVFERIAKAVVERAEKDSKSRKSLRGEKISDISAPINEQKDSTLRGSEKTTCLAEPSEAVENVTNAGIPTAEGYGSTVAADPHNSEDHFSYITNPSTAGAVEEAREHAERISGLTNLDPPISDAYTFFNNMLVPPDLWQIPMGADWELRNQFPGAVFSQGFSELHGPGGVLEGMPIPEQPVYGYGMPNLQQDNQRDGNCNTYDLYDFFQ
ncbi:transcriptional regulator family: Fungal Specific TF [Paecilomyces variotii]|nr:transcriptional regulator family: Fungal Specific TF [Paecilomyces variotii]